MLPPTPKKNFQFGQRAILWPRFVDFLQDYPFYSPSRIRRELELRGAKIRKSWGQNYLIEPNVLGRMARELEASPKDSVLEIGPGLGALSRELLLLGCRLYAIEIDPVSCELLQEGFANLSGMFFLKKGDALASLQELAKEGASSGFQSPRLLEDKKLAGPKKAKMALPPSLQTRLGAHSLRFVCGNLPYYISTPLLEGAMRLPRIRKGLFLVQEEFARRILAQEKQSSFAIFLKNFGDWTKTEKIPAACFYPRPKVDSIALKFSAFLDGPLASPEMLERLLRMSFHSKRKKLINSWKMDRRSLIPIEAVVESARQAGISPESRAEDVPLSAWYACARYLEALSIP